MIVFTKRNILPILREDDDANQIYSPLEVFNTLLIGKSGLPEFHVEKDPRQIAPQRTILSERANIHIAVA